MPTLVNNLRAIRGPVTSVPMVGASGVVVEADTQNNQVVVRADETVLWEGELTASTDTITVSENFANFERVRIYWRSYERGYVDEVFATSNTSSIVVGAVFIIDNGRYQKSMTRWDTSNGTSYSWTGTIHGLFSDTQTSSWNSNVVPLKIIGINRKANA
jgi:hypothetical protein